MASRSTERARELGFSSYRQMRNERSRQRGFTSYSQQSRMLKQGVSIQKQGGKETITVTIDKSKSPAEQAKALKNAELLKQQKGGKAQVRTVYKNGQVRSQKQRFANEINIAAVGDDDGDRYDSFGPPAATVLVLF